MKKNIHQTNEDRLAGNTEATVGAIHLNTQKIVENTRAIQDLHATTKDDSTNMAGFSALIKGIKASNDNLEELKNYIDHPEIVVKKLEEVKSAHLASNITLKKIEKAVSKEPQPFPTIPKADFSHTNKLLEALIAETKKPCVINLVLE